jgi:uncharacterized protein YycO
MITITDVQPADIFVTRNAGGLNHNDTYGYWNHCAIFIPEGVVEAQAKPGKVILSDLQEFLNRYPLINLLRTHLSDKAKQKAVDEAKLLIGTPYSKIEAMFYLHMPKGPVENCTTIVRKAYMMADTDPGWILPDDVITDRKHLTLILQKNDITHWANFII